LRSRAPGKISTSPYRPRQRRR